MALARTHLKPLADGEKIHPSDILNEGLTGNTYYVIPTANANYAFFKTLYDIVYSDGSNAVANTITAALSRCVSGRNDRIVLQPGATYAENVTVSKDNVSIVGANIFANSKRAIVQPTSGIALTVGDCHRFSSVGVRYSGVSGVGVRHSGEAAYFENCDFTSDTSHGFQFFSSTTTSDYTGSGTTLYRCLFRDCGAAGLRHTSDTDTGNPNYGVQATNVNVWECQFYGNTGDDIDDDAQAGNPTYFYQWDISGNKFMTRNKAAAGAKYLDMDGGVSQDCLISNNFFASDEAFDTDNIDIATGAVFAGNYAASGIIDGSTF